MTEQEVRLVVVECDRPRNEEIRIAALINDGWQVRAMSGLTDTTVVILMQRDRAPEAGDT